MANVKFANYISTALAAPLASGAATCSVVSAAGLPSTSGGGYFYLTLIDLASASSGVIPPAQREIVKVTGISGTTLTITRGQDGTAAQNWSVGDVVELRLNAQAITDLQPGSATIYNNVKDFGAIGDGVTDDTTAINNAITDAITNSRAVFFPPGTYLISSTISFTGAISIFGCGKASVLNTTTAGVSLLRVLANAGSLFGGEVRDLTFNSSNGAANTTGLMFSSTSTNFIALWRFHNLHFTGVKRGIGCDMAPNVSGSYHVAFFSNNIFDNITVTQNAGGNYPDYGVKFDGGCGPHNVFTAMNIQCLVAGFQAGDGGATTGLGDLLIANSHFNLCTNGIVLTGPSALTEYRNHVGISNCQFDGGVTNAYTLTRMEDVQLCANVFGFGVRGVLSGQNDSMAIEENSIESRYGLRKTIASAGLFNQSLGTIFQNSADSYASALVELSISGFISGTAMAHATALFHIEWNVGVPTITKVQSFESPAGVLVLAGANAANAVNFTATATPAGTNSRIAGNVRVVAPMHSYTTP